MMQTGIFTGYFPYGLEETAKKIRALGFNTVQLDLHFKDIDLGAGQITKDKAKRVRDTFRDHDLPICAVSGYTNIIHPDLERAQGQCRAAEGDHPQRPRISARPTSSPRPAPTTPRSEWMSDPKNKTEEGFETCRKVIADLAQDAYDHGAMFLLETYVNNVVGSVEETVRMFAAGRPSGLGLLMDPTNYFEAHNIDDMDKVLNQVFDTLADKIKIAHAKDVARGRGQEREACRHRRRRRAGQPHLPRRRRDRAAMRRASASLNYDLYLQRLGEKHPNIPVIIEHLDEADVPRAKKFLDDKLRRQRALRQTRHGSRRIVGRRRAS